MTQSRAGSTEERIVEAAVRLFAQQGFSGTSTREIARLADVNETSLFRYFPRKQDLFWAAVQSRLDRVRLRKELQAGLEQNAHPETVVPLIVEFLVQTAIYQPELLRLLYFSWLELRPTAERVFRQQLAPIFQAIAGYLSQCIENGIVRKSVDPALATISFAMTILSHQSAARLLMDATTPYSNAAEAVSAYSAFWLSALVPENGAAAIMATGK